MVTWSTWGETPLGKCIRAAAAAAARFVMKDKEHARKRTFWAGKIKSLTPLPLEGFSWLHFTQKM